MPNFEAKTRDEMEGKITNPGESVPVAFLDGMRNLGQTEHWPRKIEYRHKKHTLDDITRPNTSVTSMLGTTYMWVMKFISVLKVERNCLVSGCGESSSLKKNLAPGNSL